MIKFPVGGTAYGTIPPIVDSTGAALTPTSVAAKTYKNGSTTATGDTVTILTYTDANGLRGWSYNPAGESELDVWRIQIEVVISGVSYYHTDMIQAVVVERGTDNAALASGVNVVQIAGQTASASGTVTFPNATLASTTNITAISSSASDAIADRILLRNVSNVESTAGEHTLATVVLAMLEWEISGSDLVIKRTDGSTVHYTKTLSSAVSSGDIITGLN